MEEVYYNPDDYHKDGFLKGSPFRCYKVVEIHPLDFDTEPEVVELVGKRGVLTTCSFCDNEWAYSLAIQSGERWSFDATELTRLGITLTQAELYGPPLRNKNGRGLAVMANALPATPVS